MSEIIALPSPNFNQRPDGAPIDSLVIHYTGMRSAQEAFDRMCDPQSAVSAHYCIDQDGKIYQLVSEEKRAWHAGISHWRGRDNLNDFSIGVEIVNAGHEFIYTDFPQLQIDSVLELCVEIVHKHQIKPENVVGHSDISPDRKSDPGERFQWKLLAENGVGLWSDTDYEYCVESILEIGQSSHKVGKLQRQLKQFGYQIQIDDYFGVKMSYVVEAFQKHFTQDRLDGAWDKNMQQVLDNLLKKIR